MSDFFFLKTTSEWIIGQDQTRSLLPALLNFPIPNRALRNPLKQIEKKQRYCGVLLPPHHYPCSGSSSSTSSLFSVPLQAFGGKSEPVRRSTIAKITEPAHGLRRLLLGDRLGPTVPAQSKATAFVYGNEADSGA